MVTVADVLRVDVEVNTGASAGAVNAVTKELQGIGATAPAASQATSTLSGALSAQNQNALRLVGALVGVNVGLSAVSAIGREVHSVISDVVDTSIRFGGTMAEVAAVSGASADQLVRLSAAARGSGTDIGIGGNEGARGLAELTKGGVSVNEALGGALRATELMARAGGVDLAQAAEISAVAINSFGLSAAELPHVADLVAAAANASAIDVNDFRQSLTQAGAVARTIGVSFGDTSVAIAELGQAGLKGSDAGTSLRTFLLRLNPESQQAADAMRSLGIITADGSNKFFDASGKAKGLADVSQVLSTALAGYTDQQKIATLQTIFGTDAVRAASIFARQGAAGFTELQVAMAKIGAEDVAHKRLDSLAGDMQKLGAEAERLKIALGESLTGGRGNVQGVTREVAAQADVAELFGGAGTGVLNLANIPLLGDQFKPLADQLREVARQKREADQAAAILDATVVASGLAVETAGGATGAVVAESGVDRINALLKPARDLRAELDGLGTSSKSAAEGVNILIAATGGLMSATEGDIRAVAAGRAETALRLREQATGVLARSGAFRQQLVIETTDTGISSQDRARSAERLAFFDQEQAAQTRLAEIERSRANADRAVKTEQDLQRQAALGLEIQQLPLQDAALQDKIASLQIDQQAAPIRSAILGIEERIAGVTNQRLNLERELAILLERQRSAPGRNALDDSQTRIRELQLELQTRDPSLDRGAIRREIRGLERAQPGLELDVLRSDRSITAIQRQQNAQKLADDIATNGLNQQKVGLQAILTPLEQKKRLIDEASAAVAQQLELEKAQFDQGQAGSRQRLLEAQRVAGTLGLSADEQQAVINNLGLPQAVQGPNPIAGAAQGNGPPISVTIQNLGDNIVRSDADIAAIQAAQQQAVIDAIASVFDKAATNATPPADTDLTGARRPQGQPQ